MIWKFIKCLGRFFSQRHTEYVHPLDQPIHQERDHNQRRLWD